MPSKKNRSKNQKVHHHDPKAQSSSNTSKNKRRRSEVTKNHTVVEKKKKKKNGNCIINNNDNEHKASKSKPKKSNNDTKSNDSNSIIDSSSSSSLKLTSSSPSFVDDIVPLVITWLEKRKKPTPKKENLKSIFSMEDILKSLPSLRERERRALMRYVEKCIKIINLEILHNKRIIIIIKWNWQIVMVNMILEIAHT